VTGPADEEEPKPARASTARHGALLEILMRETLDPGYAEAAQRKAAAMRAAAGGAENPDPDGRNPNDGEVAGRRERLLLGAGGLLLGLLLVVAYLAANRSAPADARVRSDLRQRIVAAEHDNSSLTRSAGALQSEIDDLGSGALGPADARKLHAAELAAGNVAVQGEGLRVVIGNPSIAASATATGRRGSVGISSVSVLTDTDVRSVVNELWADGAEAIAVDNVRLTPTSAIRFAGQAVLVDFQPVDAPYTISAIGSADDLDTDFASSAVADRFRTLTSAYGFTFTITQESHVSLPASSGAGPRYARPGAAASTPSVPTSRPTSSPSGRPSSGAPASPPSGVSSSPTPSAGPTS
jgi:uncharacterized protein YlxW (UPF0749 family)